MEGARMSGWFDEEPDESARPPRLSPRCEVGECAACPGYWWTVEKQVAVTCEHDCHAAVRGALAAAYAGRPCRPLWPRP
jgi:hypothetical protein